MSAATSPKVQPSAAESPLKALLISSLEPARPEKVLFDFHLSHGFEKLHDVVEFIVAVSVRAAEREREAVRGGGEFADARSL